MKTVLEIGDKVKVKNKFESADYEEEIRKLAGQYVTIRDICGNWGYYIKETEGLECDDVWEISDFDLN